jgi:hypothetical protein
LQLQKLLLVVSSLSPFSARLVITTVTLHYSHLVYSIYDSTEEAIKKMIEASQKIINNQQNSSVVNRDFKLKIKTLENAPIRDPDKLKRLLRLKEREKDEAMHIKDIERLVTEIEMLKVVLCI